MAQIAQLPLMHWSKVASLETPMSNSDPAVNTKDSKSSPNFESAPSKKEPADSKKKYTSSGSNEGRSPLLCLDELGEFNTRLFLKGLSPEIHSHVFLYSVFRSYGKIRMLALNSKRHNALVEYEDKAAAATAKKGCKTFRGIDGKIHGIKIFWGKHINRELPLKKNDKPDMQVSVSHKNQEGGTEHMLSLSLPLLPVSLSTKREHLEADTSDSSNNLELEDTGNFWCYEKSIWLPEYSPWLGFRNLNSSSFRNLVN